MNYVYAGQDLSWMQPIFGDIHKIYLEVMQEKPDHRKIKFLVLDLKNKAIEVEKALKDRVK